MLHCYSQDCSQTGILFWSQVCRMEVMQFEIDMNKRNKEWRAEKKETTAIQWDFQKLNDYSNSAKKLSICK